MTDSERYRERKNFFDNMLTIYGRKPVLEAMLNPGVRVFRLHLADSNKEDALLQRLRALASEAGAEIVMHERKALSRISRNGKQDQGVAADLRLSAFRPSADIDTATLARGGRYLALDRINNPQNLGMIIRSVAASGIDGLILPRQGGTALSPLVIKASAGALFRAPLYHCQQLAPELRRLQDAGARIIGLSSHAKTSVFDDDNAGSAVYVLGNETEGLGKEVAALCQEHLTIPMHNGVESLNVAVSAALIAFAVTRKV